MKFLYEVMFWMCEMEVVGDFKLLVKFLLLWVLCDNRNVIIKWFLLFI